MYSLSGLYFMLNENYFTDTFILHDQTLHPDVIDNFNKIVMKENKEAQTIDHNFVAHHVDPASDYINELIKQVKYKEKKWPQRK